MRALVRHADAGNKRDWSGPDAERPLSEEGWEQAAGLVDLLAGLRIERLLTSPLLRCRQTLEPLAAALELCSPKTTPSPCGRRARRGSWSGPGWGSVVTIWSRGLLRVGGRLRLRPRCGCGDAGANG